MSYNCNDLHTNKQKVILSNVGGPVIKVILSNVGHVVCKAILSSAGCEVFINQIQSCSA